MTGLELKLPSEAQWEYACRAGTETPRYREDLNEIAWYRENSEGETHPVGQKAPNDWGLYDTLGNVYEWCEDVWTDDYNTKKERRRVRPPRDPGRLVGRRRAVRARGVPLPLRALVPGRRPGLPLCRVQGSGTGRSEEKQEAERAGERGGVGAEHPGDRDQASGAGWINLDAPGMDGVSFATLAPVRVSRTSSKSCSARRRAPSGLRPSVGTSMGSGRSSRSRGKSRSRPRNVRPGRRRALRREAPLGPVRQRLRWIPPGRFLMGSPPDEEGRYSWEGPQHEVTIAEGFWMFDTPCTQALWEALMGENPSEFKSPDRPVER